MNLDPRRPTIFLHIGAMKTGTTYLQDLMALNREALAEAGYLFPGERWADQSRAVRDVLGFSDADPVARAEMQGMWAKVSDEMLAHRGKASILSMEFLSFADEEQAARVAESLSRADVHVVLTVRDTASTIPAQWQTSCRNGGRIPLPKFISGVGATVRNDPHAQGRAVRMFQRTQGVVRMLDVWVPVVGADRVHVVTVPPRGSDPDLLWNRFAEVVGVRPEVCVDRAVDSNPSLGHASTELLRLVNSRLGKVSYFDYTRTVKRQLARGILVPRAPLERKVRLNRRGLAYAARWNEQIRSAIEARGVHVAGSLEELPVAGPGPDAPKALDRPSPDELLAAAATARDGLLTWADELRAAVGSGHFDGSQLGRTVPAGGSTPPDRWSAAPDPLATAVSDVTEHVRTCMELRRAVRALDVSDVDREHAPALE